MKLLRLTNRDSLRCRSLRLLGYLESLSCSPLASRFSIELSQLWNLRTFKSNKEKSSKGKKQSLCFRRLLTWSSGANMSLLLLCWELRKNWYTSLMVYQLPLALIKNCPQPKFLTVFASIQLISQNSSLWQEICWILHCQLIKLTIYIKNLKFWLSIRS